MSHELPEAPKRWDYLVHEAPAASVCLTPETIALYEPGHVVHNTRTGEWVCVRAVGAVSLNVLRGVQSDPVAMDAGDELLIAGKIDPPPPL